MPGKLTLIRHGETQLNHEDRIRGWKNVPLNKNGIYQAVDLSEKMKSSKIDHIHSSDLKRAIQTSVIINKKQGAPITLHPELRPWNVGSYTAKPTAEVLPKMKVLEKPQNERLPAPGGESFHQFKNRFLPFLQSKMQEANQTGKHIVLSTHYRNLSAAEAWIKNGMPKDHSLNLKVMDNHNFSKPTDKYDIPSEALKKA